MLFTNQDNQNLVGVEHSTPLISAFVLTGANNLNFLQFFSKILLVFGAFICFSKSESKERNVICIDGIRPHNLCYSTDHFK